MFAALESMLSCVLQCEFATVLATAWNDTFGREPAFDQPIWDAVLEGTVAIAVFGICLLLFHLFGFGDSHKNTAKSKKSQTAKKVETGSEGRPTIRCHASDPVVAPRLDSQSLDALCARVRSGQAANLPMQFDKSLEQANKKGSDVSQECLVTHHLVTVLRSCASARRFHDALAAYDHCSCQVKSGEPTLWSLLVYIAVEADRCDLGIDFFYRLCKLSQPTGQDFVNMVRCYVRLNDLDGLRHTLAILDARECKFDHVARNKALAACVLKSMPVPEFAEAVAKNVTLDAVGYNTLMKMYAKSGCLEKCIELRIEMSENSVEASEVTFGIMLDACVGAGDYERASRVFAELRNSGVQPNVVHWTTFIKGLIRGGCLSEADRMLNEMFSTPGTKPDLITYSTLVKAHADQGNVGAALGVLAKMIDRGVRPDEIIFNSVLCSCAVGPGSSEEILSTFDTLLEYGLKPSTMTLSVLLKALLLSNAWGPAFDLLANCPQRFNMEPEMRLYVQIVQAAMKSQNGRVAVQGFEALFDVASQRGESLDPAMVSRLLRQCASSCNHETVLRMRSVAKHANKHIEPLPLAHTAPRAQTHRR